ncbi:class I SAM-dependent methyltransferase [Methyloversatilis sp. XJ19-49]|uniref:class I SAM-dependent methyltransferase n=1 Tax=Methyloversatilis sp. XJ19-49 TaxID=2963429 RepID=UPI00211BC984|nr:class I SAM-dependent methyltransferase [Methyloversatilis sp. XJ19-49]MCQ9378578.1 class I SAM-dependent methyltransferase [Methyloversatilis sp. XJ19-49]
MVTGIDRPGALDKAFEFIYKSETSGDYFEFGVFQGVSLARAVRSDLHWRKKTGRAHVSRFFGFDSFRGLPVFSDADQLEGYAVFQPGQFADTDSRTVYALIEGEGVPVDRVCLIPGFFSDSLVAESTTTQLAGSDVAIAHIDCDLYSSAKECLDFLGPRLVDGAVLLFDDWFCYRGRPDRGVHKAFDEWRMHNPHFVSDFFNYSWAGRAFIVNLPL